MKVNEIERLLTRYYDGETSETEEKELKRFFTEEDVPAHLLAEKEIFMQLAAQPAPEIPEGLESRLSRKIDQWDTGERTHAENKKTYTGPPLAMDREHSRQPAHPALRRTVPIQALSGTARYLRHPRRSIRTGPEGTYHAFQQPE
mgnify:FL=1